MAEERASVRKPAVAEQRPAAASRTPSGAAAARPIPVARSLQQRLGNQGTQAFAAQVVAKSSAPSDTTTSGTATGLSLSQPGDAQEREAESVAEKVMRMAEPGPPSLIDSQSVRGSTSTSPSISTVQRLCADCENEKSKRERADLPVVAGDAALVSRSADADGTRQVSAPVAASIHDMQGGGAPLPDATRAFFEPRFGADFSQVRLHTNAQAADTAKSINAKAFTIGRDIAFSAGQYAPESHEGQRLLAHELTHVVQQEGAQLLQAQTQAKEGAATGGASSERGKGSLNFLSTLDSPAAVLAMRTLVGNRVVARLIENRMSQPGGALAGGGAPAAGSPSRREAPPPSSAPSPAGAHGGTAAELRPTPGAAGGTTAPVAGGAASGAGSVPAVMAVDAVSGAGGAIPAAGAAASEAGAASATPLPAPIAALANLTASTASGVTSVAGGAVSTLGNQLSVKAYKNAPKGPMPTGLPTGPEPVLPQEPTIPEARDVTPGGDPESPGAIEAAAQGGATQLEGGRRAAEQAAAGDMGVGALAPTEQPDEIPELGLKFVLPTGGPPPIDAIADPEVADLLERVHGKEGRETAARELGPAQSMLADGEQTIDSQHTEAAELLRTENERGTLEQVAAREEARMAVEQDKAKLREENTKAIEEYQREASSEKTTAEAEVRKAKEDARKAEEQARNQPEEEEDEAWYEWAWSKVKSGAKAVAGAVKDAVVAAYRFVKDRVKRFFSKVRELVNRGISKIRVIGGRIYRAIRDKVKSALKKIKGIARRIGSFVKGVVKRVGSFISDILGRIVGFFKDVIGRIADFWRKVWAFAVKVKEIIKLIANGAIQVFVDLIEDMRAVIAKVKGSIQEFIKNTPAKIQEVYDEHIAQLLNGKRGPGGQEPAEGSTLADARLGGGVARAFIQRQEAEQEEEVKETHSEGVWRHLKVRGNYFVDNWWGVVKDALFEILVPGVAIYRHAPAMWKKVVEAWDAFRAGKPSQGWDAVLDAARELWAMVGVFIAQVSIAAFIIGSILGTPIVGVAALTAIGLVVIAIDIALQAATIAKAVSNFDDADEDEKRLEADYGRVADSSIAIVIMLVLVALGAVAKASAAALLRRFPTLGRIAEGLKTKVRGGLGIKPKRPPKMTSKPKAVDPKPPAKGGGLGEGKGSKGGPEEGKGGAGERQSSKAGEAPKLEGEVPSRDGQRSIKVTEKGKIWICASPCQEIRLKYEAQIKDNPALNERIKALEEGYADLPPQQKSIRDAQVKQLEQELADLKLSQEGGVRAPKEVKWPPEPPKGDKPPVTAPDAAEWRYERYVYEKFQEGAKPKEVLPPDEWMRRYFEPTAKGDRPGRPGGPEQLAAKQKLAGEGIRIVENVELGGRFPDGVDPKPNAKGGTSYFEVGKMLEGGIPEARERIKIADEIKAMGPKDTVTFVDKSEMSKRVTYEKGSTPENPTSRTFKP